MAREGLEGSNPSPGAYLEETKFFSASRILLSNLTNSPGGFVNYYNTQKDTFSHNFVINFHKVFSAQDGSGQFMEHLGI